jgi:hypothetical protein
MGIDITRTRNVNNTQALDLVRKKAREIGIPLV